MPAAAPPPSARASTTGARPFGAARARRADPRERPVRVAFVGRAVEHAPWALSAPAGGLEPAWLERGDDLAARLEALRPDAVVVFAPEALPPGLAAELDAVRLAVLPDPAGLEGGDPWLAPSRGAAAAAAAPPAFDPGEYDRVIAADPLLARAAPALRAWRSPLLPVDDALFAPPRPVARPPRALFLGPSSERRELWLVDLKHRHDLSHYAFGLAGARLREVLAAASVGVVVHPAPEPGFPPTAALHLAAGHLLVAERLVPTRGLEPGLDHVEAASPAAMLRVLAQLEARPAAFEAVRGRGRARAEAFRASRVWPRLLADLADDLAAFP